MAFEPGRIFHEMVKIYSENQSRDNKVIICNSGSSRSSKTWDFFHFLYAFCDHNKNKKQEVYILRNKLVDCRDFTFKEFEKCLRVMGVWDEDKRKESPKPYYNILGNHIYFRGLDEDKEAPPSDIIFVNEALEINSKKRLKGWRMRCRKALIMDWNPKYTDHWCFNLVGQPNTFYTHSTYKDNKHLQQSVVNEIEQYSPWHLDDIHLPDNERRPHPTNILNGTADKYYWLVYGEGRKAVQEGAIFKNVKYIDEWPVDIGHSYGLDFGFTSDESALVKGGENRTDIYLELLMYQSTERPEDIDMYMTKIGIQKNVPITADSADKYTGENKGTIEMVRSLFDMGWKIAKVHKTKSIMFWLASMKGKRINIINNHLVHHFRKEHENYVMKEINGIAVNQPIDGFDHAFSAARYNHMALSQRVGVSSRKR